MPAAAEAQTLSRRFTLAGVEVVLDDRSPDLQVRLSGLRLNRATGEWNVDARVINRSLLPQNGPFALTLEPSPGIGGLVAADGTDSTGRPFVDLSRSVANAVLHPGQTSLVRNLALRRSGTQSPNASLKPFAPPGSSPAVWVLLRSLDAAGLPLGDVEVTESGPSGERTLRTDETTGWVAAGEGPGTHVWRFSKPGHHAVWRRAALSSTLTPLVPHPRLGRKTAAPVDIPPAGGTILEPGPGTFRVVFPAGAYSTSSAASLHPLGGQNLPALLPEGWSPVAVFSLELAREPGSALTAVVNPASALASADRLGWVRWDPARFAWVILGTPTSSGTTPLSLPVPGTGTYALVVADQGAFAPPAPVIGSDLAPTGTPLPDLAGLTASGVVRPAISMASKFAADVTANASLQINLATGPLPSGTVIQGDARETYRLNDGTRRFPPSHQVFVVGYQRPGDSLPNTLQADFPIRPSLLFAADELAEARIILDAVRPTAFAGQLLPPGGAEFALDPIRLLAGGTAANLLQPAQLLRLDSTLFSELAPAGEDTVLSFEIALGGGFPRRSFALRYDGAPTNATFVLGRVFVRDHYYGLEPLERFRSDAVGRLLSTEPASPDRLPGLTGSGRYVLVRTRATLSLLTGVARDATGTPTPGLVIRVAGQPWITLADESGRYQLLAPRGAGELRAADVATGREAASPFNVLDPTAVSRTDLSVAPVPPQVASLSPADGAKSVARVTAVTVVFSRPVHPGSVAAHGIQLLDPDTLPVPASVTLDLRNTTATLLPTAQLAPNRRYTVQLSPDLRGLDGLPLAGPGTFSFTTESDALVRLAGQVISHEPTNGLTRLVGGTGLADPESPVILLNETTGRTATVLSKPDGSFDNVIEADVDDLLSATVVNRNGTRTTTPVSRQLYRDGGVGLFRGGGILEAQSDGRPVQVILEPGSIPAKTRFNLDNVPLADLMRELKNGPETGKLLGGVRLKTQGDVPTLPADVSFPVNVADLALPPGVAPTDASFALTIPREIDGRTVFEIIDRMQFDNGRVATHSPPFRPLSFFDVISVLAAPLMISVGSSMTIAGHVMAAPVDPEGNFVMSRAKYLPGAFVTAAPDGSFTGARGQLRSGQFFCVARGYEANYAIMVPVSVFSEASGRAALSATDPRFPGRLANRFVSLPTTGERLGIGNSLTEVNLIFPLQRGDATDIAPPSFLLSHDPVQPVAGSHVVVRVEAIDDVSAPINIDLRLLEAQALDPSETLGGADVVIQRTDLLAPSARTRVGLFRVYCTKPAQLQFQVSANDSAGNVGEAAYAVVFGAPEVPLGGGPPPANPLDTTGPRVLYTIPGQGGILAPGQPIVVQFDEPVDRSILAQAWFFQNNPFTSFPSLQLDARQTRLQVFLPSLATNAEYTLTLGQNIKDLVGNRFDQKPSTNSALDSFELKYRTAALPVGALPDLQNGSGIVSKGIYALALDRASSSTGGLVVYDLSHPTAPAKVASVTLPGAPRDLLLIPRFSFIRRPDFDGEILDPSVTTGLPVETHDLLAIVGGFVGTGGLQYLRILDVDDPLHPRFVAGAVLTLNPSSAANKLAWSPPTLAYLELSDVSSVNLLDLQAFIYANSLTVDEMQRLPLFGRPGVDLNGDGDYVDPGEVIPLPRLDTGDVAGKTDVVAVPDTIQDIIDFTIGLGGRYVGAVLGAGRVRGSDGAPAEKIGPAYRTLLTGSQRPTLFDGLVFTNERPTRVTTLFNHPVAIGSATLPRNLALVSLTSDVHASNRIAVLDITDSRAPRELGNIPLPEANGRPPYSIRTRDDGMLMVATLKDILLLAPSRLAEYPTADMRVHPAIVGVIPGAGTGSYSYFADLNGLVGVSQGSRNQILFTAPRFDFVQFPALDPFQPEDWSNLAPDELEARISAVSVSPFLAPSQVEDRSPYAPSDLTPPSPLTHHYVLVRAPGSSGNTIDLSLETLTAGLQPVRRKGFLFPAVFALSESTQDLLQRRPRTNIDLKVRSSTAWRLSTNKASPYYNVYLSRPFVLVHEELSQPHFDHLDSILPRDVLWSGHYLRATFDPVQTTNAVLGPYAATTDDRLRRLVPRVVGLVETTPSDLIQGPNPHALRGGMNASDVLGVLGAHNAAIQSEASDLALPGRRLPIEFRRFFGGQTLHEGTFGRGWDFNFNQRLVVLRPNHHKPNAKRLEVRRDTEANSEIARAGDLLFYNSAGRILIYRNAGPTAPPEIAADPLVARLGWLPKAEQFWLPPTGLFNFFVRFQDGQFARLDPDGTQTWYNADGRLTRLHDRYEKNYLEMLYDDGGNLATLVDELRRRVEVGYWRLAEDPLFREDIDRMTTHDDLTGRIARLLDYSGRDILYSYTDDGLLVKREGPNVSTANPGSFTGRQSLVYGYSGGGDTNRTALSLVTVTTAATNGTPLLAVTGYGDKGRDAVSDTSISGMAVKMRQSFQNTAVDLATGDRTTTVFTPDGSKTESTFDKFGRVIKSVLTGNDAPPQETNTEYYDDGAVKKVTHPEGNSIRYVYDSANPVLRSRGNILEVVKEPGPRGGPVLRTSTSYSPVYNLPDGQTFDFNNTPATITLAPGDRDPERITKGEFFESFTYNDYGQILKHATYNNIAAETFYDDSTGFIREHLSGTTNRVHSYYEGAAGRRGLVTRVVDGRGFEATTVYDERDAAISVTRRGLTTRSLFDEAGHVVKISHPVDTGRELVEEHEYTQTGFLRVKTVRGLEVDDVPTDLVTEYEPDESNRLKKVTFPDGEVHAYRYDHLGRVVEYRIGDDRVETYAYDRNGNRKSFTVGGSTETYVHDGHDRQIRRITPRGTVHEIALDAKGNVTTNLVFGSDGTLLSRAEYRLDTLDRYREVIRFRDSGSVTVKYDYFPNTRSTRMTDAKGAVSTTILDEVGRLATHITPHKTVRSAYDGNGNLVRSEIEEGGTTNVETFGYNDRDQKESVTDAEGHAVEFTLGLDGRVLSMTDRSGNVDTFEYTLDGHQKLITKANGVSRRFHYTRDREVSKTFDAASLAQSDQYTPNGKLENSVNAVGGRTTYSAFNGLLLPRLTDFPRNIQSVTAYSVDGVVESRTITGPNENRSETFQFDGLLREKRAETPQGWVEHDYDLLGFVKEFRHHYTSANLTFQLNQEADDGGFRFRLTYPDRTRVTTGRDGTGRLLTVEPDGGVRVLRIENYTTDVHPSRAMLGTNQIELLVAYDRLKRPVTRSYVRTSDGALLLSMRYAYDPSGATLARQYIHRAGRTDLFQYDGGHRLLHADYGCRPQLPSGEVNRDFPEFSPPNSIAGPWRAGLHARHYHFDSIDALSGVDHFNPDGVPTTPFGTNYAAPDPLVHTSLIDGFSRGRDEIGNVTDQLIAVRKPGASHPVPVHARFTHNAVGQLVLVQRDDGVSVRNEYGPSGLRIRRTVEGPPADCIPSDLAFLYDGGDLIEIRDLARGGTVARYYYSDEHGPPVAGDLRLPGQAGLHRHYFLTDGQGSVLMLADADGQPVERMHYDAWGQPAIENPDTQSPRVSRIEVSGRDVLVTFSETVLPAFGGTLQLAGLHTFYTNLTDAVEIVAAGTPRDATVDYLERHPGAGLGTVVRVRAASALPGSFELRVRAARFQDEWNLPNPEQSFTIHLAPDGTALVTTGVAAGSTAPVRSARSTLDSPFLFQGHFFDYDTGLLYCRSRHYDPSLGLFLQPDPKGFTDSPNLFAGFANNPVCYIDPSGGGIIKDAYHRMLMKMPTEHNYAEGGLIGGAIGMVEATYQATIHLGSKAAQGLELLQTKEGGTSGLLDMFRGAKLISDDVAAGVGAYQYGINGTRLGLAAGGKLANLGVHYGSVAYLYSSGLHMAEIRAIQRAMKAQGITEMGFRAFGDKARARRKHAYDGMPNKAEEVTTKSNKDAVAHHNGVDYVSDIDIAYVRKGKNAASVGQTEAFYQHANYLYSDSRLDHPSTRAHGRPNPPFQHGAHMDLANSYKTRSKGTGVEIDNHIIAEKAAHPGDVITIRVDAAGNITAFATPKWKIQALIREYEPRLMRMQEYAGEEPTGWPIRRWTHEGENSRKVRGWDQWQHTETSWGSQAHRWFFKKLVGD